MIDAKLIKGKSKAITQIANYLKKSKEDKRIFLDENTYFELCNGAKATLKLSQERVIFMLEYRYYSVIVTKINHKNKLIYGEIVTFLNNDSVLYSRKVEKEPVDSIIFMSE